MNPVGPGDDSWLDMARALGGDTNEKEPVRADPQWEYPEGNNFSKPVEYADVDGLESPWETWNAALERDRTAAEQELPTRDPSAEVDFWRSSARGISDTTASKSLAASSAPPTFNDIPSDPRELWGEASKVTGAVADLQTQLWDELENFNLNDGNTSYRDLARELRGGNAVDDTPGSSSSTDASHSAVIPSSSDTQVKADLDTDDAATAGSGWNPDVDWKRFDDLAREEQSKNASLARDKARVDAENERVAGFEKNGSPGDATDEFSSVTYTDADGRVLSAAEVEAAIAEGAMFVDEDGNDLSTEGYEVPGATAEEWPSPNNVLVERDLLPPNGTDIPKYAETDRPTLVDRSESAARSSSSFQGAPAPAEGSKESVEMQSSRDFWRSAAREVTTAQAGDVSSAPNGDVASAGPSTGSVEIRPGEISIEATREVADAESFEKSSDIPTGEVADRISDTSNAWSQWNSGRETWKEAIESAPERDAKAEVDMWRNTARAVVSKLPSSPGGPSKVENMATKGDVDSEDNPWSAWSAANLSWEQSLESSDESGSVGGASEWRDAAREWSPGRGLDSGEENPAKEKDTVSSADSGSDWGAPLSVEGTESGNAWSSWQGEDSSGVGTGRNAWWGSRQDVPRKRSVTATSDADVGLWRSAARDLGADGGMTDGSGLVNDDTPTQSAQ
jgi:hypothetical protein